MSSMLEKLAETFVTIEACGARFMKSMSTAMEDWKELKTRLDMGKQLLMDSFLELELKEKQAIESDGGLQEINSIGNQFREIQLSIMKLDSEYEKFNQQLSTPRLNPIQSPHQVGEANNNLSIIVPENNNVDEAKDTISQSPQGRKRMRSHAWKHFTRVKKDKEKYDKGHCNYCSRAFHFSSTKCMIEHITKGKCPNYVDINHYAELERELLLGFSNNTSTHQKRSMKYDIWNHFTKIIEQENEKPRRAKCHYCSKTFHVRSTKSMFEHITLNKCSDYVHISDDAIKIEPLVDVPCSSSSHHQLTHNPSFLAGDGDLITRETNYESMLDFVPGFQNEGQA